jgi:hypothetical protein
MRTKPAINPTTSLRAVLEIDEVTFRMAFSRDVDYEPESEEYATYLDHQTGDVLWVYESDEYAQGLFNNGEDNKMYRRLIAKEPNRFLLIPGLSHGEHHEILQKFLASKWTDDEGLRQTAEDDYYCYKSIGLWRKNMGDEVYYEYEGFRYDEILRMAEEFLRKHSIEPLWK